MKKIITLSFLLALISNFSFGQDTLTRTPSKKRVDELGLDMTPFVKTYLNFSNTSPTPVSDYFITYRHYFKKSNLRAAIGGNYYYSETPPPTNNDSLNTYHNKQNSVSFRVGYEFFQNLSRRWQVYYGADIRAGYLHEKNDSQYSNGGYANGMEGKLSSMGLAPILGIRFKINKRLSLLTESSFLIQYSERSSQRYYTPQTHAYPVIPKDPKITTKTFGTTFNYPLSLILTVTI